MQIHTVKLDSIYFGRVANGTKTFEIRRNDRDYQTGDIMHMHEYDSERKVLTDMPIIKAEIVYTSTFNQEDGWIVLGIKLKPQPTPDYNH